MNFNSYTLIFSLLSIAVFVSARLKMDVYSPNHKKYSSVVMDGGRLGLEQCHRLFEYEPWNCAMSRHDKLLPVFAKNRLPLATKESAFVHAITIAGAMYLVVKNCSMGQLENCKCQEKRSGKKIRSKQKLWQHQGCSDNVAFGDMVARHFVDILEGKKGNDDLDARRTMNLHNNKVGRKIVKSSSVKRCHCLGTSNSCTVKTCSRKLTTFKKVAESLLKKYRSAIRVQYKNKTLYDSEKQEVTKRDVKLVFYQKSPDYCKSNTQLRIPGVEGRTCELEATDKNIDKCAKVCTSCGLVAKLKTVVRTVKCNCSFVWCCKVVCQSCEKEFTRVTCVKKNST